VGIAVENATRENVVPSLRFRAKLTVKGPDHSGLFLLRCSAGSWAALSDCTNKKYTVVSCLYRESGPLPLQKCKVSFVGRHGVCHSVNAQAATVFEAVCRASEPKMYRVKTNEMKNWLVEWE